MARFKRYPIRGGAVGRDSDDRDLVVAAQAGDRRAVEFLLRRHQDHIYAVCRRVTGNDADGLDATQEALMRIVAGLPRFDGRSKFSTWAYRVATNASLDELRRRQRRPVVGLHEQLEPRAAVGADPSEATSLVDFEAALAGLHEDFKAAVVLRDVLGCDYAEISEVLQIPPGTVRSRISRGRARLAEAMRVDSGNHTAPSKRPSDETSSHE